jgi:hypothetical protein
MAVQGLGFVEAAQDLQAWEDEGCDGAAHVRRRPAALPARDALALLYADAMVVAVAAGNLAQGTVLCDADRHRLQEAAARIARIAEEVGVADWR